MPLLALLLVPQVLAAALFVAAGLVMGEAGTNRTLADLYLGVAGFVFAIAALAATLLALGLVLARPAERPRWRWLLVHGALVALVLTQGSEWLATHLA